MNSAEKPATFILSASEYLLDNFGTTDRIAMLVLNRDFGETVQRITRSSLATRTPTTPTGYVTIQFFRFLLINRWVSLSAHCSRWQSVILLQL